MASDNYFKEMYYQLFLHKVVQFNYMGNSFYLELDLDMNGVKVLSPTYYGLNFIPLGIRTYLDEHNAKYNLNGMNLKLAIDEPNSPGLSFYLCKLSRYGTGRFCSVYAKVYDGSKTLES